MSEPDVAVVVSHLVPVLGMERCVLRVLEELGARADLVCIGESRPDLAAGGLSALVLGDPLRGWARVRSIRRLRRWITRDTHEVILVVGAWAALPLLLVKPRARRVIVWEHSFSAEKIASSWALAVLAAVARLLYRRADAVVCVSADLRGHLASRHLAADPVVIPNYLGPAPGHVIGQVCPLPPSGTRRLLTVGTLSATKNQQLALTALAELGPGHLLAIAGAGPERGRLEARARDLGLVDQVLFLGHVADLAPWYRWCEVVVQPARGETFGLAMFEAAAHHRPVVSLDYGLAREVIGSAVPGVRSAADALSMAAAVRSVLERPPTAADFCVADRDRRRRFASDEITRRWNEVLRPVAAGRRST